MPGNFTRAEWAYRFNPSSYVKEDLFAGDHLMVGLNCFEPGQSQALHSHAGGDKFYYVLTGKAKITVGSESQEVMEGSLVWAPAGATHGVSDVVEQTVMLIGMAPPAK